MRTIVLVTGGFDPIHSGHIEYFKAAKKLGDLLVVGVNSDAWLTRKKGSPFMPWEERATIVSSLHDVDRVINFDDKDNSAKDAIRKAREIYPNDKIIFANGGDRTKENIPEMDIVDSNLEFLFGVGGENKMNSSSWILQEWKAPKTDRVWGYYRVLHEQGKEVKLKELTVDPGKCLSMQRHKDRGEHWFVAEGTATVYSLNRSTDVELKGTYDKFESLHISKTEWHQLCNEADDPLKIIEIQYGDNCIEDDIERKI
jgi:D-beta-D-heptose 7-phosphate kinase/D-beta-D-heptose 1-phosphate adenosyltransferase